ncbi:MAG: histidine phosphatase family protein [Sneathiellaceae bacterium]
MSAQGSGPGPARAPAPRRAIPLGLLRHGATDWNRSQRLQGRNDQPLRDDEAARLRRCALPPVPVFDQLLCSPLRRARETAAALGLDCRVEPALVEMDWGAWEGQRPAELRAGGDPAFAAAEGRGLDLLPPGGESPRMVQHRLSAWLPGLDRPTLAVTHKGVIRALLALAHDWPMLGRAPARLDWQRLHVMLLVDGRLRPWCYNLPLAGEAPAADARER